MSRVFYTLLLMLLLVFPVASLGVSASSSTPPGAATALSVQSIPPSLPANGNTFNATVVSLLDAKGNPSLALTPIVVNLRSSELNVASVSLQVTIEPGQDYAVAAVTTTTTPGSTQITASSSGLTSSFFTLNTVTPSGLASQLKVFAVPSTILASQQGTLAVELIDASGLPSKATSSVVVSLVSADPDVAETGFSSVTISAGQYYETVPYAAGPEAGSAVVSAFSGNFTSGQALIQVVEPSLASPAKVEIRGLFQGGSTGGITTIPADGQTYNVLEVLLLDSNGGPATAPTNIIVQLSSSQSAVVNVPTTVTLTAGSSYLTTSIQSSLLAGRAIITAAATDYAGSNATFETEIPAPSKVTAYVLPSTEILTPHQSPILAVQLQDSTGSPASARATTSVLITSSDSEVVTGSIMVTIPMGSDYVAMPLAVSAAGTTTLTASSSGLSSSQTSLTIVPYPLTALVTSTLSVMYLDNTTSVTLTADLLGTPLAGASVTWISTLGHVTPTTSTLGPSGTATVTFVPDAVGFANVTAVISAPAVPSLSTFTFLQVKATPPKPPLTLKKFIVIYGVFIIVPLVAVLAVLTYFLRKRRRRAKEELEAAFQNVV